MSALAAGRHRWGLYQSSITIHGGNLMGIPVSLKGHFHACPMFAGTVPHVGGGISEGDQGFTVNGVPVALQGHKCSCKVGRSEEHTSELQSRPHLVCRLLLEKKNK